jgi:hypothetical protein
MTKRQPATGRRTTATRRTLLQLARCGTTPRAQTTAPASVVSIVIVALNAAMASVAIRNARIVSSLSCLSFVPPVIEMRQKPHHARLIEGLSQPGSG